MADRQRELTALLSSAALVMVGGMLGSVAKLGERVVIGRLLSPDAYGEVSLGIALLLFTTTLAMAGCSQGVSRFIPRYDDVEDRRGVWVSGMAVTMGLAGLFALGMVVGAEWIASLFFETDVAVTFIRILGLSVPFIVGFRIAISGVRGYENTVYYTLAHDFVDPFVRIGLIVVLLLAGMGIVAAGIAYLLAAVATFVLAHYFLNRLMPLFGAYRTHTRELVRFSAPLVVSTVVGVLLTQTDTLMLGFFRTSQEVGLYSAAYPLASGLLVVLTAFGFLYLPIASRLDADGDRDAVNDIYATTTKWVYLVTFPAFVLFVVFPADVLTLVFGTDYTGAATILPILAVGFFLSAAAGRDRETLSALGSTTWIAIGNAAGLALNIVVNVALIPRFGILGAAAASVSSLLTVHLIICGVLWLEYGIPPLSSEAVRTYVGLPLIVLPWVILAGPFVSVTLLTALPVLVGLGVLSLGVVALVGGFEPSDIVVIDLLEDTLGVTIPFIRRWIPAGDHGLGSSIAD